VPGLVGGQDLALAFEEHLADRVDTRPQPRDLGGIEADGVGELFLGELLGVAETHRVFEERRDEIGSRRGGARKVNRVVLLVRVDDAAGGMALLQVHQVPPSRVTTAL
jgi:hypothetical protein